MENQDLITEERVSPSVIYNQDRAVIDTQIATAKAYPRNIKRAIDNAMAIVTLDQETAESCSYAVPRQGKSITGPSVHLAKILAQQWGNMRIEAKVVDVDMTHVTSQAIAFDLETNIAIKVEVKRSIIGKQGRFGEDMITVTGNAANAIALRNAILTVIPKGAVDKVYKAAQEKVTGNLSDENKLNARRKQVVEGLISAFFITEAQVCGAVGKQSTAHIGAKEIGELVAIGQAIKDGDVTIESAFGKMKAEKTENSEKAADAMQAIAEEMANGKGGTK
jgi:citrate lyase gamma subunit